jgi:Flp pilus assembly protein TadB
MKKWQAILLAALVAIVPLLTSCDMLGLGKSKQEKEYEQRIKAIQEQQEANQKAQEEYNKQLQESLNKYLQEYQQYQEQQQMQQLQQQGYSVNETQQ